MPTPTAGYTIAGASSATTAPLPVQLTQADLAADYLPMYSSAALGTVAINLQNLLGIASQVMAISDIQAVSNKALDNTNTYAPKDTSFTLQNASSSTKRAQFLLSAITAGQTRIFTLPDYNGTIATLGGTETLTAKTLTAPVITNATITSDSYAGFSDSDSGTIYGMTVTNGILASAALANVVNTAALQSGSVDGTKLSTSALKLGYNQITTNFTTSSTTYIQVTGLTATVTVPAGGRAVRISAFTNLLTSSGGAASVSISIWDGVVASGTQLAESDMTNAASAQGSGVYCVAVVTPASGSKTYNIGLKTSANTGQLSAGSTTPAFILVEAL